MKKIFLMIMIFSIVLPFYAQHEYLKKEFKYISTAPSYMVVKVKSQTYEGYAAINTLGFREYYNKTAGILKKKMYNKLAYRDIIRNKCFVVADSDFNDVHENILAFDKIIMNDSVVAISKRGMECFIKTYFDAHGDLKVTQGVPYDFGTIVKIMFDAGIQTGIGCLYSNYQIKDERFYGEKGFTIPPEFRDSIMDDTTFSMSAGFNPKSSSRMEALHQRTIEQFPDLVSENDGSVPIYNDETIDIPSLQAYSAVANADIFYYHTNHLGSTAFVTDNNATVTQGFLYAPFGEITTEFNATFGNDIIPKYSFNAKELDVETGMYYYEARYYAPPVFTNRDPMFEKYFWMTPYAYCANNPVKFVDPSGMHFDPAQDETYIKPMEKDIQAKIAERTRMRDKCEVGSEKYNRLNDHITQLSDALKEIQDLRDDKDNLYFLTFGNISFNKDAGGDYADAAGSLTYGGVNDKGQNIININMAEKYAGTSGFMLHEFKHAHQYYSGRLGFYVENGKTIDVNSGYSLELSANYRGDVYAYKRTSSFKQYLNNGISGYENLMGRSPLLKSDAEEKHSAPIRYITGRSK